MEATKQEAKQLCEFVKSECLLVAKMKQQLSELEAGRLIENFGMANVQTQLRKMDNWLPLPKRNRSVYQTVIKWFDMDGQRKGNKAKAEPMQAQPPRNIEKEKFLMKFPIGSTITINGEYWEVVDGNYISKISERKLMPINTACRFTNIQRELL